MQQIHKLQQNKKVSQIENLLICKFDMVHLMHFVSNTF